MTSSLQQLLWPLALLAIAWPVYGYIFSGFDHNEHMYLAAAALVQRGALLYSDFAYLQMPLLPWVYAVLSSVLGGQVSWLIIGRSVSLFSWLILAALVIWQIDRRVKSFLFGLAAVLVLGLNGTLLRGANESSNYILPVMLLFAGTVFFQSKVSSAPFWSGLLFGLATSTKLFYLAFIPALAIAFPRDRWRPLLIGLLLGLAMPLYYWVVSPDLFFFQNLGYHRLTSEWRAGQGSALGFTLQQRLDIFTEWISKPDQCALMLLALWALVATFLWGLERDRWARISIFVISVPLAFVSAPVFEQYLVLPVLGALVMVVGNLSSRLTRWGLVVAAIVHVAYDRHGILRFNERTPILREFHSACAEISRRVDVAGFSAATISPLYALECGIDMYPEFATGPFLYRIMARMRADEPTRRLAVSPRELDPFLDVKQPEIIITGQEGAYDRRFDEYAKEHRYEQIVSRPHLRVYLREGLQRTPVESFNNHVVAPVLSHSTE